MPANKEDFRSKQQETMSPESAKQWLKRFITSSTPDYSFLTPSDGKSPNDRIISYVLHSKNYLHNLKIALITLRLHGEQ